MTLEFDPTGRVTSDRLAGLVRAIVAALPVDETRWLEWKRELNLKDSRHQFQAAKTILGLANRDVDQSQRWVGGYGYFVVGASAGGYGSMTRVDHAEIDAQLRRWVGAGDSAPRWQPTWVIVDGNDVLLIEVEPPRIGDPIFPLRSRYSKSGKSDAQDDPSWEPGTVFIRRAASTNQADDEEILQLSARAAGNQPIALTIDYAVEASFEATAVAYAAVSAEVGRQKVELLRSVAKEPDATGVGVSGNAASALRAMRADATRLARIMGQPDTRTREAFIAEVESWTDDCANEAPLVCRGRALHDRVALLRLAVTNPTSRNVPGVVVEAKIDGDVFGDDGEPPLRMPARPRAFGAITTFPGLNAGIVPNLPNYAGIYGSNTRLDPIIRNSGSVLIEWRPFDLRPEAIVKLRPIPLAISPIALDNGDLVVNWTATSSALDGRLRGVLRIPTATRTIDATTLFQEHTYDD